MTNEEVAKYLADSEEKQKVIKTIYNDLLLSVNGNEPATLHAHCLFIRIFDLHSHNMTMLSKLADDYGSIFTRSIN